MDGASSIAGLVSLAGLVLESAGFLYKFCSAYKKLAGEVKSVIQDVTRLQDLLKHIERINSDALVISSQDPRALVELEKDIKACEIDLMMWLQALQELQQSSNTSSKKITMSLKAVANGGKFSEMRAKIASHRQQLELQLSLMNMNLSIHKYRLNQQMQIRVTEIQTEQKAFQRDNRNKLSRIQTCINNAYAMEQNTLNSVNNGFQQSAAMLNYIDARLENMQQQILSYMAVEDKQELTEPPRSNPSTASFISIPQVVARGISARDILFKKEVTSQCTTYLMRVVQPGILITESKGQLHRKLVAISAHGYDESSLLEKQRIVKQIQNLRILIWLLEKDPLIPARRFYGEKKFSSELLLQGYLNRALEVKDMVVALSHGIQGTMDRSTFIFLAERHWVWEHLLVNFSNKRQELQNFGRLTNHWKKVRLLEWQQPYKSAQVFSHWLALYQCPKPPFKIS